MEQEKINEVFKSVINKIKEKQDLTDGQKKDLIGLVCNVEMYDKRILKHPVECIHLMVSMGAEKILDDSIPQVQEWVKANEPVTMFRIMEYLLEKYVKE